MIDYKYLVFMAVAHKLSFSKAAEELFVSQPSVSKQIQSLEDEAGVPLFERQGNKIFLTPIGKKLFAHLQKAKTIQKEIYSDFAKKKKDIEINGELNIGSTTTISLYVMPQILAIFHKRFPKVTVRLLNRNSENILSALANHEIDLACIESGRGISSYQKIPFMKDEIIAVCSKKSPFFADKIRLKDIGTIPLALRERGSGSWDAISKNITKSKIKLSELNIVARLGGTEALKNYLLASEAIGFLSRLAIQKEISAGSLKEIKMPELKITREFNLVMRRGEGRIGLIKHFINIALKSS